MSGTCICVTIHRELLFPYTDLSVVRAVLDYIPTTTVNFAVSSSVLCSFNSFDFFKFQVFQCGWVGSCMLAMNMPTSINGT
jgi:hypothetical protein